jgi:hypothetical protein
MDRPNRSYGLRKPPHELAEGRYRTVNERAMMESLLIAALPYELAAGRQSEADNIVSGAIEDWIKTGLKFGQTSNGERLFDPVEVFNHMKWTGVTGRDGFWSSHFIPTARSFTQQSAGMNGGCLKPLAEKRFSVELRRKFDFQNSSSNRKLRLRLPLPLASHARDIQVKPISPDGAGVSISQSNGRLEFQATMNEPGSLEVGGALDFTTNGTQQSNNAETLGGEERELYLRPSEGLIRITPRIAELAAAFSDAGNPLEVALKAWNFLLDELSCGMVRYDQVDTQAPGDWVLDNGWYDCQLGSSVFIAICRACGIPARLASGYMLYELAPGYHYWSEIWQDGAGWLPFDLLCWDLSAGGRDTHWRTHFAGVIDYRMVTQCFPLSFTGPMTVRFPAAWHLLNAPIPDGMEIRFTALDGAPIYSDRVVSSRASVDRMSDAI